MGEHGKMLGLRLKELREARGYSMQELADKIGVNKTTIFKWEHGVVALDGASAKHSKALAEALGTTPAYIRGEIIEAAADIVLRDGGDGVIFVDRKPEAPKVPKSQIAPDPRSLRLRSYAMDVLAADSGYAINYTPDGDVILTKGNFHRQITQNDLDGVSEAVSHFTALALARLLGGQS